MSKDFLYIAEKPDMAAKIASNLPTPHIRKDGYIETGGGYVTWAIGHLLEQVRPEDYDEKYAKWNYADLPIVPQNWKLIVSKGKSKQVNVIRDLLKVCSAVVNAGDPGREGQLIVDEILDYLKNKKPVKRLILQSLDKPTVLKALANLEPNTNYTDLYMAALGRQRADWLIGMNLTRAYTILGKQSGYNSVLSVGRVQSPTLAIVVKREDEIINFVPQTYYTLNAEIEGKNPEFTVKYITPREYTRADNPTPLPSWLDEEFRIKEESKAKQIVNDVINKPEAKVVLYKKTSVKEKQPLPFKLSNVQSRMNAKFGISVEDVLKGCQSLYEKGYASYPRTDCQYLPPAQLPEAGNILNVIASAIPSLANLVKQADTTIVSPAWDEKKLGEHHAIIPTGVIPNMNDLDKLEAAIYELIAKRYLAQFLPECEVDKVNIEMEIAEHLWSANGRTIINMGWRNVYAAESEDDDDENNDDDISLPALSEGEKLTAKNPKYETKTTKPPSRYTQGTLLTAMENVHKLVKDPNERKMLMNVEGIGRAATRANIISTLVKRGLLETEKKFLIPSDGAKMLVKAIDPQLTDPGLTARWEHALDAIAKGQLTLQSFQQKQETWLNQLISAAKNTPLPPAPASANSSGVGSGNSSGYSKPSAKPATKGMAKGKTCPKCSKPMAERTVKSGNNAGKKFLGCSGFPNCNHVEWPK